MRIINVPTGNICIVDGEYGRLEFLSIGDYGKDKNIKADFLGHTNIINGVPNGQVMPLEEKWVITISTQYGCSMNCKFCDVPKVGIGKNATINDLSSQIKNGLWVGGAKTTKRLNIHYARMGEPTFNFNVIEYTKRQLRQDVQGVIGNVLIHPVVSTMLPVHNHKLYEFLNDWCDVKNDLFRGDAGLQLSINSTSEQERQEMFSGNSLKWDNLKEISDMLPIPKGRKYALNFALAGYEIDSKKLKNTFPPEKFMCKITPMHETNQCKQNDIHTKNGYINYESYLPIENNLKSVGFDVLVFIPSIEEDESRITCGNAILSDLKENNGNESFDAPRAING
jgi:23S rRNA (adenine2503-C2)-methyltransferase